MSKIFIKNNQLPMVSKDFFPRYAFKFLVIFAIAAWLV
jgi:hypothetical protein